jgi:hypothetical protein
MARLRGSDSSRFILLPLNHDDRLDRNEIDLAQQRFLFYVDELFVICPTQDEAIAKAA